jgi:nanoRNase/pAp phosphatase (c-di-AMP/oligoRNAs hydrolase)
MTNINEELSKAQDMLFVNPESNAARQIITKLIEELQNSKGE